MDVQIHAAIVGGLIAGVLGGLTVAGGIWVSTTVERRRERRRAVEVAFEALNAGPHGRTVSGFVDRSTNRDMDGPWYQSFNQTYGLLTQVQLQARNYPGADVVRQTARDAMVSLLAANDLVLARTPISPGAAVVIADLQPLRKAIYGDEVGDPEENLAMFNRVKDNLAKYPMPSGSH